VASKGRPEPLTMTEYAKVVGISRGHAFREQKAWRACCGDVSVFDVLSEEVWANAGWSEDQREAAIARELMGGVS
jgi:hypothetical protein